MALSLATIDDLEVRWRALSAGERNTAQVLMEDASALLRAEFPGIDQSILSGALQGSVVAGIVAAMAKRAMLAPADGITNDSNTAGPYSHTVSYANPLGNVFLTAAERVLILGRRPRAMSVRFQ